VLKILYKKCILLSFPKDENQHLRMGETDSTRLFLLVFTVFNLWCEHRAITEARAGRQLVRVMGPWSLFE
jgi:hypothetical protein